MGNSAKNDPLFLQCPKRTELSEGAVRDSLTDRTHKSIELNPKISPTQNRIDH